MTTQPLNPFGLKLQLEATSNETIVHCQGKITAENAELFQRQIRDLIPESRAQIAAIARRIIVDLSNVTHVDSTGSAHCCVHGRRPKTKDATLKSPT